MDPEYVPAPSGGGGLGPADAIGHWAELVWTPDLADVWPPEVPLIGFVYFDPDAGISFRAAFSAWLGADGNPAVLVLRATGTRPGRILGEEERILWGLPSEPDWLPLFGPQPMPAAPWRTDPALHGRFHPAYPDDLQVRVHDGSPQRTGHQPEVCWVRIIGRQMLGAELPAWQEATWTRTSPIAVYQGILLNDPFQLFSLQVGDLLQFVTDRQGDFPLLVTDDYVAERPDWLIRPCPSCGMSEMLDPPSLAIGSASHRAGELTVACPRCPGYQTLEQIGVLSAPGATLAN